MYAPKNVTTGFRGSTNRSTFAQLSRHIVTIVPNFSQAAIARGSTLSLVAAAMRPRERVRLELAVLSRLH